MSTLARTSLLCKGTLGVTKDDYMTTMDNGFKMGPIKRKMAENTKLKNAINTKIVNPFQPSGKLKRSPLGGSCKTPQVTISSSPRSETTPIVDMTKEDFFQTPKAAMAVTDITPANSKQPSRGSPNQEFISKMRKEEASAMGDIKKVLIKIKAALRRQKNISIDVKDGIQEVEELICIAETSRSSWIKVEMERQTDMGKNNTENAENTPLTSIVKRTAESPLEKPEETKKRKNVDGKNLEEWRTVSRRKTRVQNKATRKKEEIAEKRAEGNPRSKVAKKVPLKNKPEALIIKPTEGHSYADVLKNLRDNRSRETDVKVRTIRKTKTGSMLVELERGERVNPELFSKVKEIMKNSAEVRSSTAKVTLNIRDLDALTTTEEVAHAIGDAIKIEEDEMKIKVSKPNSRELIQAYVTLPSTEAEKLLRVETVKIGWCRVRVRRHTMQRRCFRCFGTGHEQWNCTGPDRRGQGLCIRCSNSGHMMKNCTQTPKCCLCVEAGYEPIDHLPAFGKCRVVRKQL